MSVHQINSTNPVNDSGQVGQSSSGGVIPNHASGYYYGGVDTVSLSQSSGRHHTDPSYSAQSEASHRGPKQRSTIRGRALGYNEADMYVLDGSGHPVAQRQTGPATQEGARFRATDFDYLDADGDGTVTLEEWNDLLSGLTNLYNAIAGDDGTISRVDWEQQLSLQQADFTVSEVDTRLNQTIENQARAIARQAVAGMPGFNLDTMYVDDVTTDEIMNMADILSGDANAFWAWEGQHVSVDEVIVTGTDDNGNYTTRPMTAEERAQEQAYQAAYNQAYQNALQQLTAETANWQTQCAAFIDVDASGNVKLKVSVTAETILNSSLSDIFKDLLLSYL